MEAADKHTILIVDDKPANIFALEQLLEKSDRVFLVANNGKEGLKIALNKNVDLIILDVQMPEMDGFEVAQILKSGNRTKDIPIIFASAERKEHKFILKGFEEGAVDYLFKPLDPELTRAKVAVLLQIQDQRKELIRKNISLERSALLINNATDIVGIIDPASMCFEDVNKAFTTILGYSTDEAQASPITFFIADEDKDLVIETAKLSDERISFETKVFTKTNQEKYLSWRIVVNSKKWYVNARDVTEQKLAEQQIRQLNADLQKKIGELAAVNKDLESFSYSVSHDLRAPLRSLDGYSKILEEDYQDKLDEEGRKLIGIVRKNARKMDDLINDLLEFSRLGRKPVEKAQVNMQKLVETILGDLNGPSVHNANITVNQLLPAPADHSLMTQVWINLVSNAIKYSSKKQQPQVEIGSFTQNGNIVYYVKDNGAGFDMAYVDRLFGVFQRLHKAAEFKGTGVGLALVHRIVSKHGGRVWAEGKVDEGATFYFALPEE